MDYAILKDEITNDPLSRGYSAMTDAEVAFDLNTQRRTRQRPTLDAAEIYEAITVSEFQALNDTVKAYVRDIYSLGTGIVITTNSKARQVLLTAFDAGSESRAALVAAATESISRATELGLRRIKTGYVQKARA